MDGQEIKTNISDCTSAKINVQWSSMGQIKDSSTPVGALHPFQPVKDHYSHCYQSYASSGGKKHLQRVRYHVMRVVLEI